jgi:hypothetical protein
MRRAFAFLKARAALVLLPISAVPFALAVPILLASHSRFVREHEMGPLPAPLVTVSARERARFAPLPATPGQVPVLAWHKLGDRGEFKRKLLLLKHLGYTPIGMEQWARFRGGDSRGLPHKPIVLTFDDGRLDTYRGADATLRELHMRAAMFVITGPIVDGDPAHLSWAELHRMHDSGRWDIEPEAGRGHQLIPTSAKGSGPFYTSRRFTRSTGREPLADWEARVAGDLYSLRRQLIQQGFPPHAFAYPWGDSGARSANDPAIVRLLGALVTRQFTNSFVGAGDPAFTRPGGGPAERFAVGPDTSLDDLYGWLRRHSTKPQER